MAKIGLILACDHYPAVSDRPEALDAQLRLWLRKIGVEVTELEVFAAHEMDMPRHAASADVWIVSGVPLPGAGQVGALDLALHQFLRTAATLERTLLALHHGEHVLHRAVAGFDVVPPSTPTHVRAIRNPFRSFQVRDGLHQFNPRTRRVEALVRPLALRHEGWFRRVQVSPAFFSPDT